MSDDRNEVIRAHERLDLIEEKLQKVARFVQIYKERLHPKGDQIEDIKDILKTLRKL